MGSDDIIPIGQFKASCPQCGAELGIKRKIEGRPVKLKGDERLFCPVHGDVMSLEEARRAVFEENRDDIIDKARKLVRDRFRDSFKK